MKFKQRGYNPKFPEVIETWEKGDEIPDWLSNNSKITFIDGEGNKQLGITYYEDGGYEIANASGTNSLVRLSSIDDLVCYGDNRIFGLTKKQLNLLYGEPKGKM